MFYFKSHMLVHTAKLILLLFIVKISLFTFCELSLNLIDWAVVFSRALFFPNCLRNVRELRSFCFSTSSSKLFDEKRSGSKFQVNSSNPAENHNRLCNVFRDISNLRNLPIMTFGFQKKMYVFCYYIFYLV